MDFKAGADLWSEEMQARSECKTLDTNKNLVVGGHKEGGRWSVVGGLNWGGRWSVKLQCSESSSTTDKRLRIRVHTLTTKN